MLATTILVDDIARCVVRPVDTKDLMRFLRNGRPFLLTDNPQGRISHRPAEPAEAEKWRAALALHTAWGGGEEDFFGVPL
ncbi:hypothetical protein [Aquabacter spiritensis]|uniref:Uncharacterized protein n=1 Tax=Aquabacter spiritensis TaxID=933073 RepID=A0A4R3M6I7_9HYPH|nr:hypothetical protein [Aquabacter spiritensis]TCT07879.1 hypothetical protein EDC64_101398 [Aquabacter spiritensis]